MAEKICKGNCLECSMQQQIYCSAQRTYGLMKNQESIVERIDRLAAQLSEITSKEGLTPIAQNDAGAENRASEQ